MSDKVDFEIFKRFGPSILKVKIPEKIINNLNSYVDQTISDDKKIQKQNLGEGLVGDVTQEFSLEQDIMEKTGWGNFLASCVSNWINMEMKKKITKFKIRKSWIVRQFKNEYNPTHWHSGHISGAGFLKVPNTFGKHVQNKQNRVYRGGNLQLIHGSKMFLCESTFTIVPEVGDFYFFPNYMMHTVFPFKDTNEERRSISFNADIDNEIYNVYGE
ncbi:2OG-Fe(II) oxygenase family protein [Candidatus Pelagibacter sp.]|nr:2OG-Fe(II) oxygenase family protein [Candidatus Pelagibacter sp.]